MSHARVLIICFLLACGRNLPGQISSGALRGIVQDRSGAHVAGAVIEVRRPASQRVRRSVSDAQGTFLIEDLAAGRWEITVATKGFATTDAEVTLALGTTSDITVALDPAAVHESVNVRAGGSSIARQPFDLAGNVRQGVVSSRDLEELSLTARSFANVAYLARAPSRLSHLIPPKPA